MTDHKPAHEVELYKREDAYDVYVDLPGYDAGDVDVRWHDGRLHVGAERHDGDETRVFNRDVSVPRAVDDEAISAAFEDGVLEVTLPIASDGSRPGTTIEVGEGT